MIPIEDSTLGLPALLIPLRTLQVLPWLDGLNRILTFGDISFISSVLLAPMDRTKKASRGTAIAFICSFAGPWRPLAPRIEMREGIANLTSVVITTIVQHDISFYSANERFETVGPARNEGLECCREDGYFPILGGRSTRLFTERQASIIFLDAGYRHGF
jgi:hypothetical protein